MTLEKLSILGAYVATHQVFPDERGLFREWFRSDEILSIDEKFSVQQANFSRSKKSVIRGIHYSLAPTGQAKIVTCTDGMIVDVLIDLRVGSPSYLRVDYIELVEDAGKGIYIPSGIGHGFIVKSEFASVVYLTSSKYAPGYEKGICPTDPDLGIAWPIDVGEVAILSKQDREAQKLSSARETGILPIFSN